MMNKTVITIIVVLALGLTFGWFTYDPDNT